MEKNVNAKVENQKNEHAAAADAEKAAKFKAQKAEAAKKFKERKAAEAKSLEEIAKEILPFVEKGTVKLTADQLALLQKLANPALRNASGTSFFNKVFGDSPKVGDSVKLIDYFNNTGKAKADLDKYVKQWAEKGTIVEVKPAAKLVDTVYTIVKLA